MATPPLLPQDDPNPERRSTALIAARSRWTYGPGLPPLAVAASVPPADRPKPEWAALVVGPAADTGLNDVENRGAWVFRKALEADPGLESTMNPEPAPERAPHEALHDRAEAFAHDAEALAGDLVEEAEARLHALLAGGADDPDDGLESISFGGPRGRPGALSDYRELFRSYRPPAVAASVEAQGITDAEFARLRVAGPNPELLDGLDHLPLGFPDTLALADGELATAAAADGRLFIADYSILSVLRPGYGPGGVQKYVGVPRALFGVDRAGALLPIAIQCVPRGPVFTPGDAGWALAKLVVQVADGNHHEMVSHLGRTHLLVEPFVMATRRELAPNHPLSRLLLPHCEGTIFINANARSSLIAPNGAVDQIFAGTIDSSKALSVEAIRSFDFARDTLPERIARRRTEAIRDYPWRDDALKVWEAVATFVSAYVARFYPDAATVAADWELAAWSALLARPFPKGGAPGFVAPRTPDELAAALTLLIWTASAQHASVNFPQFPDMGYAPLTSGAGWRAAPSAGEASRPGDLSFYPPLELALRQAQVLYLLSAVHYTTLGVYGRDWFGDPAIDDDLVPTFQAALKQVEQEIRAANAGGRTPYTHLLPSLIPQSINI